MTVGGRRDVLHGDGVVDITTDDVELTGLDLEDDIAVAAELARRQVVISDASPAPPVTDQIAALRRVHFHPLGRQHNAWRFAQLVAARGVDVIGVGFRVGETVAGTGHPHYVRDERGRPGIVAVLALRENLAVFVVNSGPGLLLPARVEAEPPIFTDPLPHPFLPLLVHRQLDVGEYHLLAESPPLAQRDLYGGLS